MAEEQNQVMVYQLGDKVSVTLPTGETVDDADAETLAEKLYARGYRVDDVFAADWHDHPDTVPGAGQAVAVKWKLRRLERDRRQKAFEDAAVSIGLKITSDVELHLHLYVGGKSSCWS